MVCLTQVQSHNHFDRFLLYSLNPCYEVMTWATVISSAPYEYILDNFTLIDVTSAAAMVRQISLSVRKKT